MSRDQTIAVNKREGNDVSNQSAFDANTTGEGEFGILISVPRGNATLPLEGPWIRGRVVCNPTLGHVVATENDRLQHIKKERSDIDCILNFRYRWFMKIVF